MYYFKIILCFLIISYICEQIRIYQNLLEFVEAFSKGQGHIKDDFFFWFQNTALVVTGRDAA